MWKKILLVQTCVCLFLITGYISIGKSDSELLLKKRSDIVAAISLHNSAADFYKAGKEAVSTVIKTPEIITDKIIKGQESQQYAEPIDNVAEGAIASVYAVSGGQVAETGENEEMGKYIIIQHDNAVSVYGNCSRIYAEENKHVRRGQVIGSFVQSGENEFYYNLIEE